MDEEKEPIKIAIIGHGEGNKGAKLAALLTERFRDEGVEFIDFEVDNIEDADKILFPDAPATPEDYFLHNYIDTPPDPQVLDPVDQHAYYRHFEKKNRKF